MKIIHEINNEDKKINAVCLYCGKTFGINDALSGEMVDVDHIIPRTLFFDDSQNNKILVHRACNASKGNLTAYDFMKLKGEQAFKEYTDRVEFLHNQKIISKVKRDRLLTPGNEIPDDFIERQLRETQYISRKSREILNQICYNVWSTSGGVTEKLRKLWGWDDILMQLQLPKYRELGLTEEIVIENSDGTLQKKEVIKGWTKRNDQRHHAIDALTIACTEQGFIQRINTLSSEKTRNELYNEVKDIKFNEKLTLLEKYLIAQRPFTTEYVKDKVSQILVSYKSGKRVATKGRRIIQINDRKIVAQDNILVPRGPLSEEKVYGRIKIIEKDKPISYLFKNPHLIVDLRIKELVETRLQQYQNDVKQVLKSVKKEPIFIDDEKSKVLEKAHCYVEKYVIKYPVEFIKQKKVDDIVDEKIRQIIRQRFLSVSKESDAFKEPVYFDEQKKIPIRSVRMFTGLTSVEPIRWDENNNPIAFVKPGNNHHIAIYMDENGNYQEHACTFWHAVERKKYGFPVIIENTAEIWNRILANPDKYPTSFVEKLPADKLQLVYSMQQNEMFIMGMQSDDFHMALQKKDYRLLSNHLYRVQKLSASDYVFRHHLETEIDDSKEASTSKRYIRIQSLKAYFEYNPYKVRINYLGQIVI